MNIIIRPQSRRHFFNTIAAATAFWTVPGAFAEELIKTPAQTEGPFYPDKLPLDTDNDLIVINDKTTPAVGTIVWLSGRVLDMKGQPIRNALVEIWQCDNNGAYLHSGTGNKEKQDANFQGFGRFITGSTGEYLFRTIKPVPYPGRTPHIHMKVKRSGKDLLTTQCYVKGHPQNAKDGIFRNVKDQRILDAISVDYQPIKNSKIGELAGKFDVILGVTPEA